MSQAERAIPLRLWVESHDCTALGFTSDYLTGAYYIRLAWDIPRRPTERLNKESSGVKGTACCRSPAEARDPSTTVQVLTRVVIAGKSQARACG